MKSAIFVILIIFGCSKAYAETYIDLSLDELLDIEITTAGKQSEKISEIPASVVVITREDIETFGYTTVEDILENIPGLYQINEYSWTGSTNFGVRGFFSKGSFNDLIILVNGVNQLEDMYNSYPVGNFSVPVEAIDRIEVVRGPMSVIYGSGAFFGAVNIITNEIKSDKNSLVSASYGTNSSYGSAVRVAGSSDKLKFTLNAAVYNTDGADEPYNKIISSPFPPVWRLNEDESTAGQLEDNRKYINFSGNYKNFFLLMCYGETEKESFGGMPSKYEGSLTNTTISNGSIGYRKDLSDLISVNAELRYFSYRFWGDYKFFHKDIFSVTEIETNAYEVELNAFIRPLSGTDISLGLFRRTVTNIRNHLSSPEIGMENTYLLIPLDEEINTYAFFTQANYALNDHLKLVAGIRAEQLQKYELKLVADPVNSKSVYDQDDIQMILRFAAIYTPNSRHVFKLLYGEAIKQPSFGENADPLINGTGIQLEAAKIQTAELNYTLALNPQFTATLSLFGNNVKNLIVRDMVVDETTQQLTAKSANSGDLLTNGAEISLNFSPIENLKIELSGTYQKSEDKKEGFEDIDPAYSPEFLAYIKASYLFPHNIRLGLSGIYVDEMESSWEQTGANPKEGHRLGEKTEDYLVFNANLRIDDVFKKGIYCSLKATNLFDGEIRYPATSVNSWADKGMPGPGRNFLFTVGMKF